MDQVSVTLLGTAVIVALGVLFSNSRTSGMSSRLSDTNGCIDGVEGVLGARLRHVEEKLGIR